MIKSKPNIGSIIILLIGCIGMSVLSYKLVSTSLSADYPQLTGLILGAFFGLFAILCIIALLSYDLITIDKEYVTIKSVLGFQKKKIHLRNIRAYNEIKKRTKHTSWTDLTIFYDDKKLKITSSMFSNYSEVKSRLTRGKRRDVISVKHWHRRSDLYYGIGFIALGLLMFVFFTNIYPNKNENILEHELSIIQGTVDHVTLDRSAKGKRSVRLGLKQHPKFIFSLSGINFDASEVEKLLAEVKQNDKIELKILSEVNEKKLLKTTALSFWDKTINYKTIDIYDLRDHKNTYLDINHYNKLRRQNASSWARNILIVVSFLILTYGLYLLLKAKRPITMNNE
ncbi:hypothetical protein ELS83_19575 [Marinifilum sp. JC070]|uniref:DUF3592 domain-containing protein n=2 Tax=Marinifilum caeruleilacunae TaxID=2499076 RepID=A0ABX1X116_9BACT|nr:hypothetical protein [Marinifilum caeruleilacunae]